MSITGTKTVTAVALTRFNLDIEKEKVRRNTEAELAAEGKEIIGYSESLPAFFLGSLTQELTYTWKLNDRSRNEKGFNEY